MGCRLRGNIADLTSPNQYNIKPFDCVGVGQFASGSTAEFKKTEKTAAGRLHSTSPQVMGAALLLGHI